MSQTGLLCCHTNVKAGMSEEGDRGKKENRAGNRYGQTHLFWHHYHFGLLQSSFGTAVGGQVLFTVRVDGW